MPFNQATFAPVGGQSTPAPGIFTYSTITDTVAQTQAANYFQDKQYQLSPGDEIYCYCTDGSAGLVYNGPNLASSVLATVGSGMPVAPDDGEYHLGQGANWFDATTVLKADREVVVRGTDTTNQEPSTTDSPIQVTFGPAVNTPSDPVNIDASGVIHINETDNYHFRLSSQYGRNGSGGTAWLWQRVLVNGVQTGVSVLAKLNNAGSDFPYQAELTAVLPAGVDVTVELWRDSVGANDGGYIIETPTLAGANPSYSADIIVSRYRVKKL